MPGDISGGAVPDLSQSRCANKSPNPMRGRPKTRPRFALGSPRLLLMPLRSGSDLWKRNSEIFLILVVLYPVEPAARAFAGVPLFWPGTHVLLDPGDEHGGIVSPGTVIHGDAYLANVLSHQGRLAALLDLEWPRLGPPVFNSRPSAKRPRRSRPDVRGAVAADGTPRKTAGSRAGLRQPRWRQPAAALRVRRGAAYPRA